MVRRFQKLAAYFRFSLSRWTNRLALIQMLCPSQSSNIILFYLGKRKETRTSSSVLPFDDCAGYTLGMPEEVSCKVIIMSNPTNSNFDLLEFMIDSYFRSI